MVSYLWKMSISSPLGHATRINCSINSSIQVSPSFCNRMINTIPYPTPQSSNARPDIYHDLSIPKLNTVPPYNTAARKVQQLRKPNASLLQDAQIWSARWEHSNKGLSCKV